MAESTQPTSGEPTTTQAGGRPTIYTPDLAADFCAYLAMGESLRTACGHKDMPAVATVFRWLSSSNTEQWAAEFREQYARAKEESADAMAEEILYIADNTEEGETIVIKEDREGNPITETRTGDMLGHRRLQIDTRKFLMAKMKPKRYGDKLDLTSDGEKLGVAVTPEQADQLLKLRAKREPAAATPDK